MQISHWVGLSGEAAPAYPALEGEAECDIAIVGAGFTGLSTAVHAAGLGARVTLLEKQQVGAGASGRTGGIVVPTYPSTLSPREVEAMLGPVYGARLNEVVANAASRLFDLVREHGIACDPVQNGWIAPGHDPGRLATLREICGQWKALGADVRLMEREEVAEATGARGFHGGWMAPSGGHVNPYALCCGLARVAGSRGVVIHEHSPALAIEPAGGGWVLRTPGGRLRAAQILLGVNAHADEVWPGFSRSVIPVRLFMQMSRPVSHNLRGVIMPRNQCFTDVGKVSYFSRYDRDGRLMTGGAVFGWPRDSRRQAARHARDMLGLLFPQLGEQPELEASGWWEGYVGINENRLPALQQLAPGVYALGGYSTRGVALSHSLAPLVAEMLCGRRDAASLPLPMGGMAKVPGHAFKKLMSRLVFPFYKRQDRRRQGLSGAPQ